jgi:hypothetical protein
MKYIIQVALTNVRQLEINVDGPLTLDAIERVAVKQARREYGDHDEIRTLSFERALVYTDQTHGKSPCANLSCGRFGTTRTVRFSPSSTSRPPIIHRRRP